MDSFERIKGDIIAIATCAVLGLSVIARIVQAAVLHLATDMFPLTEENIWSVLIGLAPSVFLLIYVMFFYKQENKQWILPLVYVLQLCIAVWSTWVDYESMGSLSSALFVNLIWIVYYVFLIYVTYKGIDSILLIRIVIGGISLYSTLGSVVTVHTLISYFPEETVMITAQVIAVIGYCCYYLATFLIVPKVVEENNKY